MAKLWNSTNWVTRFPCLKSANIPQLYRETQLKHEWKNQASFSNIFNVLFSMSFKAITDRSLACVLDNCPKNYDGVNKLTYFGKILFIDQRDLQCLHIIYYGNGCSKPHVVQVGVNLRVGSPRIKLGCSIYDLYIDHNLWWPQMHGLGNQLLYCWLKSWELWKFIGKYVFFCAQTSGKIIALLIQSACNLKT